MDLKKEIKLKNRILNLVSLTIGVIIMAIGIDLFLVPNQLSTGGFSGIATIGYYLWKIPLGTTILILNIPLFIIAFIKSKIVFVVKSPYIKSF